MYHDSNGYLFDSSTPTSRHVSSSFPSGRATAAEDQSEVLMFSPWIGTSQVPFINDGGADVEARILNIWNDRWHEYWPLRLAPESDWAQLMIWNHEAGKKRIRRKVCHASNFDWTERKIPADQRARYWSAIKACPNLDFLITTANTSRIDRNLPLDWEDGYDNVWLGVTFPFNLYTANRRIKTLLATPAKHRYAVFNGFSNPAGIKGLEDMDLIAFIEEPRQLFCNDKGWIPGIDKLFCWWSKEVVVPHGQGFRIIGGYST